MVRDRAEVRCTGRGTFNASYNASLVTMTVLGLSWIFIGLYQIDYITGFLSIEPTSFFWSNNIFILIIGLYSMYAIRSKMVTEGLFYLLATLIMLIISIIEFYKEYDILAFLILFSVGFLFCGFIFRMRGELTLEIISFMLFVYSFAVNIIPTDWLAILGLIVLVSGVVLVIVGCAAIVGVESGKMPIRNPKTMSIGDSSYPQVFEDTIGSFLLALITFLYVYAVFFDYDVPFSYYVFTTAASIITLMAALYGIYHGIYGQTVLMFLLALSKLIFTFFGYLGMGSTTHIDLLFVVVFVPLMVSFYVNGQKVIALLTLATSITTVAQTFTGYVFVVEGAMAISEILAVYWAMDTWYNAETGIRLKDTEFARKLFRRDKTAE